MEGYGVDGSGPWFDGGDFEDFGGGGGDDDDGGGDDMIDLDMIFEVLDEGTTTNNSDQTILENAEVDDLYRRLAISDASNPEKSQLKNGCQKFEEEFPLGARSTDRDALRPSHSSEPIVAKKWDSGDSSGYDGKLECSQIFSPVHTLSRSPEDSTFRGQGTCSLQKAKDSQSEIPSCSTASSFVEDGSYFSDHGDNLDVKFPESHGDALFGHVGQHGSNYTSQGPASEGSNLDLGNCGGLTVENFLKAPENNLPRSNGALSLDTGVSSCSENHTESAVYHGSAMSGDFSYPYLGSEQFVNMGGTLLLPNGVPSYYHYQFFPDHHEGNISGMKSEIEGFATKDGFDGMVSRDQNGMAFGSLPNIMAGDSDVTRKLFKGEDSCSVSPNHGFLSSNLDYGVTDDKPKLHQLGYSNNEQDYWLKDRVNDEHLAPRCMVSGSVEVIDEAFSLSNSSANELRYFSENYVQKVSTCQKNKFVARDKKEGTNMSFKGIYHFGGNKNHNSRSMAFDLNGFKQRLLPCTEQLSSMNRSTKEKAGATIHFGSLSSHLSKVSPESIQSNSPNCISPMDDDDDLCILEDISQPPCSKQYQVPGKSLIALRHSVTSNPVGFSGVGGTRIKPNDERSIFQAALQDISLTNAEASLPDGVLAVPLLRHQRIALSWMVQKETECVHCSGGILADDQGLGKTVSTIALILKERAPLFRMALENVEKGDLETLTLDEDDSEITVCSGIKQDTDYSQDMSNSNLTKNVKQSWQGKGRQAAGTLVVCPTSVLRQWAEELRNKVTNEANLSVLVYHGSNRTKDPCELSKYDVVLTTYSIVTNEVPKQPVVDKDGDKGASEVDRDRLIGVFSSKKRKHPPCPDKNPSKHKKKTNGALLESISSPLAKVAWFRVILDEAQSIKNYRTQVARACWGLRAKRRWLLSGTPIQNAVDDLYSYFRFLRYEPYAVYKSFCTAIKFPISKSPTIGYRKLQAVLRTIMLRRTKGTLLDGKPIINLPPKSVELKQVEFSSEERDFYERLEADSRAQFKEYAEAGTVKENYVNILLMLLRLRQACDHPLLVKGFDSSSFERISVDKANKLPQEKRHSLLKCLEASLALCGICKDPPEDAVVTICGHVFCNQCICDYLSGDENQCPESTCKVRVSISSVFSRTLLSSALPGQGSSSASCVSTLMDAVDPYTGGSIYDSSKIKAALELLLSLTKTPDCPSTISASVNPSDRISGINENSCAFHATDLPNGTPDNRNGVMAKSSKHSDKRVGEKAIVFSQWTKMLDLLETCLKNSPIQYRRLDGTMSVAARDRAVKDFNALPEVSVIIMSLKAASLGLNMVAASRVLLLDLWWNPTTEDQAIDRAHRIGQTRPVTVFRLTVKDTVEDRILALQRKKREMVASAFGEDDTNNQQTRLTVEDLSYLFMM